MISGGSEGIEITLPYSLHQSCFEMSLTMHQNKTLGYTSNPIFWQIKPILGILEAVCIAAFAETNDGFIGNLNSPLTNIQ